MNTQNPRQYAVALLTLALSTDYTPGGDGETKFHEALGALLDGQETAADPVTIGVSVTIPPEYETQVRAALATAAEQGAQHAVQQVGRDAQQVIGHLVSLFYNLCLEVSAKCPDLDLAEFLRQEGLSAAS